MDDARAQAEVAGNGIKLLAPHPVSAPVADDLARGAVNATHMVEQSGDVTSTFEAVGAELEVNETSVPEAAGQVEPEQGNSWPVLDAAAYHGLVGEVTHLISPHTEADDAAILFQTLAAFGIALGRRPYYQVEGDRHHGNLFLAIVGVTGKGRKGTSWGRVQQLFKTADPALADRIDSGLSSGEGLISAVRDGSDEAEAVADKRLLILESELASALKVMRREGNTLSPVVRNAWDTGNLRILTKNNPVRATDAHIGVIGHITKNELLRYLNESEFTNGLANRFLYVCARRSKALPFGGSLDEEALALFGRDLCRVLSTASTFERLTMSPEACEVWGEIYGELSDAKPGLFGSVIARSEAQVMRLALLYALLDTSHTIERPHLEAALACWDYCETSARYIFGTSLGDPVADTILDALKKAEGGLTRTKISGLFRGHAKSTDIERSIVTLKDANLAFSELKRTVGRPTEVWYARQP